MSQLKQSNATVLGISTDNVDSHKRFVEKEHLNFSLLADTEKKMTADYGVLAPSGFANRVTFVIGPDGIVREVDRAVNSQFERLGSALTTRHASNLALLLTNWKVQIDQPAPNFSLKGIDGKTVSLLTPGKRVSVVLFLSAKSPKSIAYSERIRALAASTPYKDVAFLGIYPNRDETLAAIKANAELQKFPFPVARDNGNKLADHFGATVTPSIWVFKSTGIAACSGAIDDNAKESMVTKQYLKDALDTLLAGRPVAVPETKASGAGIKRVPVITRVPVIKKN